MKHPRPGVAKAIDEPLFVKGGSASTEVNATVPLRAHMSVTPLEALAHLGGDLKLCADQYKNLLASESRHGTLQIIRTALLRAAQNCTALIDSEEM